MAMIGQRQPPMQVEYSAPSMYSWRCTADPPPMMMLLRLWPLTMRRITTTKSPSSPLAAFGLILYQRFSKLCVLQMHIINGKRDLETI